MYVPCTFFFGLSPSLIVFLSFSFISLVESAGVAAPSLLPQHPSHLLVQETPTGHFLIDRNQAPLLLSRVLNYTRKSLPLPFSISLQIQFLHPDSSTTKLNFVINPHRQTKTCTYSNLQTHKHLHAHILHHPVSQCCTV